VQDIRAKLRAATAEEHRRTEASFAAVLATLADSGGANSYGAFLRAHARAFPAIGRALSAGLDWPAWRAPWRLLLGFLETIDPVDEAAAIAGARTAFDAFRAAAPTPRVLEPAS
jgi:heme oxygenase